MSDKVNQEEKYPSDKNYHYYYSSKYLDRVKSTNHCREKNIVKTILVLPADITILGFNILGVIAMNLCYIVT